MIVRAPAEAEARLPALRDALAGTERELLTPALVIDLDAVTHNVAAFVARVGAGRWRPHVKTIKQSRLVRLLLQHGIDTFKCATVDEVALVLETAERVRPDGAADVLLAMAPSRPMIAAIARLQGVHEGGRVSVLADDPEHAAQVSAWLDETRPARPVGILLDVDLGMHRTGSAPDVWRPALAELTRARGHAIAGLHGYEGHLELHEREPAHAAYDELVALAHAMPRVFEPRSQPRWIVTSGSHAYAHAMSHAALCAGPWRHQVSPGTIVLSDLHSAPAAADLGLVQAAFVVSRVLSRPTPDRVTLDAGSKALSPDRPVPACAVLGWPGLEDLPASEEHRPFRVREGNAPLRGELLWLVPDHVCTTVNLHRQVLYVRGGKLVGRGRVEAMSRTVGVEDPRP